MSPRKYIPNFSRKIIEIQIAVIFIRDHIIEALNNHLKELQKQISHRSEPRLYLTGGKSDVMELKFQV